MNKTPITPPQAPVLWTVLAWVRREIEQTLLDLTRRAPPRKRSARSLLQSPNLLVNPGAEVGDPSLSGYAAVTVPGWTVTGTPTVIKYGTQRRFPVPTPTPGPVLPGLLAFPSGDGAIPPLPEASSSSAVDPSPIRPSPKRSTSAPLKR